MATYRPPGARRLVPLLALASALGGCASGIRLGDAKIAAPSGCPEIKVLESGDVELCHHRWARWTGDALERDGRTLFVVNRGLITAGGHEVARADEGRITIFLSEDVEDRHIRIEPSGKVVDEDGEVVATISPPPDGELPTLVFAALIREGLWLPALPSKPSRISATEVQVLGRPRQQAKEPQPPLCACADGS